MPYDVLTDTDQKSPVFMQFLSLHIRHYRKTVSERYSHGVSDYSITEAIGERSEGKNVHKVPVTEIPYLKGKIYEDFPFAALIGIFLLPQKHATEICGIDAPTYVSIASLILIHPFSWEIQSSPKL